MENNQNVPGKGAAVASLVLGIIAVVLWFFGYTSIVSVILGIVGLVCAGNAKKAGFMGGLRTAGFVLSLIGRSVAVSLLWLAWLALVLLAPLVCSINQTNCLCKGDTLCRGGTAYRFYGVVCCLILLFLHTVWLCTV